MAIPIENIARMIVDNLVTDILHLTHEDQNGNQLAWASAEMKAKELANLIGRTQQRMTERGTQLALPFEENN